MARVDCAGGRAALSLPSMIHVAAIHDGVRVAHLLPSCETLGPGRRGVIWVAGCARRCPGCIAGPILSPEAGTLMGVDALAELILSWDGIEGITLSGGEPFEQAGALAELCLNLRRSRDLSILSYTGFTLDELRTSPEQHHRSLLDQLDILIDGPFIEAQRADLLWRGSDNQSIHFLSPRHQSLRGSSNAPGVGIELHVKRDGTFFWAGIPERGFEKSLADRLQQLGIHVRRENGVWV